MAARTFLIVSESPNVFSYLRKGLLFYITAIQETFGDTLTSELFAIFAVNPVVVIELKSTKALTLPYLYISEPLRMQHRTVGIFENGFLKVISIFNILFAGMVTNSLNPACRLLFYNVGYSSLNVRTRANVRTWHNLTRCSYSYTCVECHDRRKHYRRWYILFGQSQVSVK